MSRRRLPTIWFFLSLVLLLSTVQWVKAHGGIDDGDETPPSSGGANNTTDTSNQKSGNVIAGGNVGLAFGLTGLCAAACIVGAMLPFLDVLLRRIPSMRNFSFDNSGPFLASSTSFAAGILLGLSLCDLWPEAQNDWRSSLANNNQQKKAGSIICVAIFAFTLLCIAGFKKAIAARRARRGYGSESITTHPHDADTTKPETTDRIGIKTLEDGRTLTTAQDQQLDDIHKPVDKAEFRRLGIQIAVVLLLHNLPEGLATFTVTLASEKLGILYSVALALHKLPEGFMVALPIFVATGSRWWGFLIAAVVGTISQFLGAILGYLLFVTYWNPAVSGTLFCIVVAALTYIVIANMLPLAQHHDKENRYVVPWFFGGLVFFVFVSSLFTLV